MALAACAAPTEEAAPATAVCDPAPTAGHLFTSKAGGYCLIHPQTYCWLPGQDALSNTFVSMYPVDEATNRCTDDPLILHGEVVWLQVKVLPAAADRLYAQVLETFRFLP